MKLKLSPTQSLALRLLHDPQIVELLFGGGAGGAKASWINASVYTPFGPKRMGDIRVGDQVSNPDGTVSRVIAVHPQGVRELFDVTFIDGATTRVTGDHLWLAKRASKARKNDLPYKIYTTQQLLDLLRQDKLNIRQHHILMPLSAPVQFTINQNRWGNRWPADPYVVGVLLGDGSISQKNVHFTTGDLAMVDEVAARVAGKVRKLPSAKYAYSIIGDPGLKAALISLGMQGKRAEAKSVPETYLKSPIEVRRQLLQGLMDTDGTIDDRGHCSFTSVSERLARDVQWLVRSLGGKATLTVGPSSYVDVSGTRIECQDAYRVYINTPDNSELFLLERKRSRALAFNGGYSELHRRLVMITPAGQDEAQCITVDNPNGLYITDDFIVTHNSFLVCIWMVLELRNYPRIRIGLGREELVRLKQTTVVTLLSKVHPLFEITERDYVYNEQKGTITYSNGSQIILIDMKFHPSDPLYDTFGSLELTHVVVEEVGEVKQKGVDVLNTRKNRFLNTEYGIVGKSVYTCNPTQNFIKEKFYKIYDQLGGGRFQKWPIGQVEIPGGRMATAFRAFIRSLVFDNPCASRNYIETLRSSPPAEQKRLLRGDWNVDDDDYMLFPSLTLDRSLRSEVKPGRKVMGVDIADGGKDSTYATVIENGVATDLIKIPVDHNSEVDTAEQVALGIIKAAQQRGIDPADVGIDGVGVGAGARVSLRSKGWKIKVFKGGDAPTEPGYADLRSEQFWQTSQDLRKGELGLYVELAELEELRDELRPHLYTNDNEKVVKVTPKTPGRGAGVGQSIKEKLGRSPDRADSLIIARWVYRGNDSKNADNHIIY